MTDTAIVIDPLATLPTDVSSDVAREHVAALVKGKGVTLEQANASLASRGAAPLTANSKEMAEAARTALLNDSAFVAKYSQGDPEAIAKLFQLDLQMQQTSGKLTDRPASPGDYNIRVAPHMPSDMPPDRVAAYSSDFAQLASAIQLPKENAQALTDAHFEALKATSIMNADEQSMYGQQQTAMLHNALGADAENIVRAATETFAKAGRPLKIEDIVKSNGAEAALILVHQAQALSRQKR